MGLRLTDPSELAKGALLGVVWPRPGKRNIPGDTLGEAAIPPHPVTRSEHNGIRAIQSRFHFNLT